MEYSEERIRQAAEAAKEIMERLVEAIKSIIEAIKKFAKALMDKLMEAAARDKDPRWWHYYKHAKKKRVRNKYEKRIRSHLMNMLAGQEP